MIRTAIYIGCECAFVCWRGCATKKVCVFRRKTLLYTRSTFYQCLYFWHYLNSHFISHSWPAECCVPDEAHCSGCARPRANHASRQIRRQLPFGQAAGTKKGNTPPATGRRRQGSAARARQKLNTWLPCATGGFSGHTRLCVGLHTQPGDNQPRRDSMG